MYPHGLLYVSTSRTVLLTFNTYAGNTNDVATFVDQLDKLKKRFKLENITVVGDGGMIKSEDIQRIKELGYDYITSIGKPSIQKSPRLNLINNDTNSNNISNNYCILESS